MPTRTGGAINVRVVDGSSYTGLHAADGSWNVVEVEGDVYTGFYHPCGAINVFYNDGSERGFFHPCGALNVYDAKNGYGATFVNVVDGSLGTPSTPEFLLMESGDFLLLETDDKILLE